MSENRYGRFSSSLRGKEKGTTMSSQSCREVRLCCMSHDYILKNFFIMGLFQLQIAKNLESADQGI